MEVVEISKKIYNSLGKLQLNASISNTEAEIFIIPNKDGWNKNRKILKKLYCDEGDTFGNKLLTVNALIDRKDLINIAEMILPDKIAIYNKSIIGFTLDYIKNINFATLLKNSHIPDDEKRRLFVEINNILIKMKQLRENNAIPQFYLNDLHEGNFIYNIETKHINVVDLDSCKIAGNHPFASKYLTPFSLASALPYKYHVNPEVNYPGYIIPDENSDLYCYNMMVLNYLYHDKAYCMHESELFDYLAYLRTLGYNYEALDVFYKMFTSAKNESIAPYIEAFPKDQDTILKSQKINYYVRRKSNGI
jgi:hypothetical protein